MSAAHRNGNTIANTRECEEEQPEASQIIRNGAVLAPTIPMTSRWALDLFISLLPSQTIKYIDSKKTLPVINIIKIPPEVAIIKLTLSL